MNSLTEILSNTGQYSWYILLIVSFLGGVLASISPCSLALLPLVISYVGGYSDKTPLKTFVQLFCFITGTSIIFAIIGLICALTGKVFASMFGGYFTVIMASLLLTLGLKLVNILDFEFPAIVKQMPVNKNNSLFLYPFLLGMLFAFMGTPCSTPILAGIMTFAAMGKNINLALIMLFLFSIGQGLIIVIAGIFTSVIKNLKTVSSFTDVLMKISGIILILTSFFLYWRVFRGLI